MFEHILEQKSGVNNSMTKLFLNTAISCKKNVSSTFFQYLEKLKEFDGVSKIQMTCSMRLMNHFIRDLSWRLKPMILIFDLNRFLRKTGMPGIGFSLGCRSREYPSSKQIFPDDVAISALL